MEILTSIGAKFAEKLVDPILNLILNPITTVVNCNNNIASLEKNFIDLKNQNEKVKNYVEDVQRRGEEIEAEFTTWLSRTGDLIDETEEVVKIDKENAAKKKCFFFRLCPDPVFRYKLSKVAKLKSDSAADQVKSATDFKLPNSHAPAPQPQVAAVSGVKGFERFDSRAAVLNQIMKELRSTVLNKIGIHGLPGVGKSMLVQEIRRKAAEEKLFEKVVLAQVKKNPELKHMQLEIARGLGMDQLPGELEPRQIADRITAKLKSMEKKKEKVLLILDDIWSKLDLEEVGIPFGETGLFGEESKMWKILFTSRDSNVLKSEMCTQKEFAVGTLQPREALQMFMKIVGEKAESDAKLRPIAVEIVNRCGGLPLAVATIANALKHGKLHQWRSALTKLKNPAPNNFEGMYKTVYTAVEVSYDHLESKELKQTFLLSCLMGHNASIENLLRFGIGLGLFPQAKTIEDARDELLTMISNLKASSLLLDGRDDKHLDMHDVIHDVAIAVACRDRHGLLLAYDIVPREWSDDAEALKDFKWISLQCAGADGLLDEFESSRLAFLQMVSKETSLKIQENLFKAMQKLRVLHLVNMHMPSLPSSLCFLKHLQTLCLEEGVLGDISVIGELKSLEVLSLRNCDFEELPGEIGQLTRLKVLDLSHCHKLKGIQPLILEKLLRLEELYLADSFDRWERQEHESQRSPNLAELKKLKKLSTLEIHIGDVQLILEGIYFKNLNAYKIFIGDVGNKWSSSFGCSRMLKLQLDLSKSFDSSIKLLLKNTEELHLKQLNGAKNVVTELDGEGFRDLRYLQVNHAPDVQWIVNSTERVPLNALPALEVLSLHTLTNLEQLFQGCFTETSFNKLTTITVNCCDQVKNLFSSSIARLLLQLKEIVVTECNNIEEIVDADELEKGNEIVEVTNKKQASKFGMRLQYLRLQHLPELGSIHKGYRTKSLFNDKVVFPNLKELQLSWINVSLIWHTSLTTSCVENLTKLIIEGCHNLEYLFSYSMARSMLKLGHLRIRECKKMRVVVFNENAEEEKEKLVFPSLNYLLIEDLQNLVGFYIGNFSVEFPSLKMMVISNCPELQGFAVQHETTSVQALFNEQVVCPSLESMTIVHLKCVTMIWRHQHSTTSFCNLKSLRVRYCEKLLTLFPSTHGLENFWTSLEVLVITGCSSLEVVFEIGEFNANKMVNSIDTHLRVMTIQDVPRLKHVWDKDPEGALSFMNLESVVVDSCQSLKNVFPPSLAKSLLRLEKLKVGKSSKVESIISMERRRLNCEEVVKFDFPRLSILKLGFVSRSIDFYPEKHWIDCPMLKKLHWNGKVTEEVDDFPLPLPILSIEKVIPRLEQLSLSQSQIAMMTPRGQSKGDFYSIVKALQIHGYYYDKSFVFPIDILQFFCKLEKLVVRNCSFVEVFPSRGGGVEEQDDHRHVETLSKVRTLKVTFLHNLTHIWSGKSSSALQKNLETLKVWDCWSLISLSTSTTSFQNITTLNIQRCRSLVNLISVATAESLVQLKTMSIIQCENLSQVVENEEGDDGTQEKTIVFSKLRYLKLHGLIMLTSFYSGNFVLKFPSLEQVIVSQCLKLNVFCGKGLGTPLLQRVESSEGTNTWRWAGDLNTTIQRMYEEKVGYARLQTLKLCDDFPDLIEIWHNGVHPKKMDFSRLGLLEVSNCNNLKYLLNPSMALDLVHLRILEVKNCLSIEQVIKGEQTESQIKFSLLWHVHLESCPDLTSFYEGNQSLELPALIDIAVKNCPKMVSFAISSNEHHDKDTLQPFFTNKVAFPELFKLTIESMSSLNMIWKDQLDEDSFSHLHHLYVDSCEKFLNIFPSEVKLPNLYWLEISNCHALQEIIAPPTMAETCTELVFPSLNQLRLHMLPKLKCFSQQVIQCPSLVKLMVNGCDEMQIFASEFSNFQSANGDNQVAIQTQRPLFWATFPRLEELVLGWNDTMKEMWSGEEYLGDYFPRLKRLELINIQDQSVQPQLFFIRSLPKLERIVINGACREISQTDNASTSTQAPPHYQF